MSVATTPPILVAHDVREALAEGHAVVCTESAVVTHGLPRPENSQIVWRAARAARHEGVLSATVGVIDGKVKVGLSDDDLHRLADPKEETVAKIGVRDLSAAIVKGLTGGTTVSATAWIASRIGVRVVCTGGLGGVHRGHHESLDASSDLVVLSQAPVAVVCAGPKAVLDLKATMEYLETLAVPVMGLRTETLPGFYYNDTEIPLDHAVQDEAEAARIFRAHRALERKGGVVLLNPVPEAQALTREEVEPVIDAAYQKAREEGVLGKAVTPRLLSAVREALGRRALDVNLAVLESNAAVAARLAVSVARELPDRRPGREGA
ncbi:MAG: pseudouridine-5'-phosphate glycosidase [Deltaproteobacteria bacterium]|nr:MAG: pseudouridine-5'-phosphate glycosidase [Deltaproteobacteria bacterium]